MKKGKQVQVKKNMLKENKETQEQTTSKSLDWENW